MSHFPGGQRPAARAAADHAALDDLYLDAPVSHLLNGTEAALFERMRTDWCDELAGRVGAISRQAAGAGPLPDEEELLRRAVEELVGRLCAEDTRVEVGGGDSVSMTLDLIEVDVRPSLLAPALLADGFRMAARN